MSSLTMYISLVLSQIMMQLFAEWHQYKLKKSQIFSETKGINEIIRITGIHLEYISYDEGLPKLI